ncbi:MAG: DUF4396 domain-containing protein [Rhodobacteraceae bacterium]|nr:DUF4396 domain-containing protein [Paracoccaceae bacterium]
MIRHILSAPITVEIWLALMIPSLIWTIFDLNTRNRHLMSLMKLVWSLTVLYSGPLGLLIYLYSGRKEIARDTLWRRGFRSVAHCYSGCGLGEIIGVVITVGILSTGTLTTTLVTFSLAYLVGFALTAGPLIQDSSPIPKALKDAVISETASITVMEITAIAVSLVVGQKAGLSEPLFYSSLILSLSCGVLAAYPVNLLLIRFGVKEGMMDPRMTDHGSMDHAHGPAAHEGHQMSEIVNPPDGSDGLQERRPAPE